MASTSKRGSGSTTPRSYESTLAPGEQTALLNHEGESDFGLNYHTQAASNGDTSQPDGMASLPTRLARSASQARKTARRSRRRDYLKSYSSRIKYYVPVLDWLPTYAPSNFIGDLTAAFTMTSLIVPQAMSYATNLAKLSPVNGLFGAAIPPIIYSLLGTCRQLSVGPEAALSLIIGEAITKFIAEEVHAHGEISDHEKMKLAAIISTVITLEAGLITFALGILRLGFLDAILSRALLRGFISAVGLVIFIAQLPPILGLDDIIAAAPSADSTISKLHLVVFNIGQTHALTALLSLAAFVVLICAKLFKAKLTQRRGFKFLSYIPEVLVVVIVSTVLTALFNWDQHGLKIIGTVSAGQTSLRIPIYKAGGYLRSCLGTSAVIAILGFLDSIVAAKDCAGKYDYPISPNRELVALGAANIVASFISGTVPGYGSITRSRLAGQTGARTPMASFLTGTLVLCVTFFLLKFLFYLPKAVLASIICVVVFSILAETPHDVKFFLQMEAWVDLGLMTMTFLLTFFVNVEIGIVVSLGLSLALCVRQSSVMRIKILGRVPGTQFYEPLDDEEEEGYPGEEIPGVLIVRIRDIALTFANAGALKERLRRLERYGVGKHHPSAAPTRSEASVIIFHLADVEDIDASALQLILEMTQSYVSKSVMVYWTHLQPLARDRLVKAGVLAISGEDSHQETVQAALNALNETVLTLGGL